MLQMMTWENNKSPTDKLKAATDALCQLGQETKKKSSFLEELVSRFRSFFSKQYRKELKEKNLLKQKQISLLSDVIQSHLPSINLLEKGSSEQKKLAEYVKLAVHRYNQLAKKPLMTLHHNRLTQQKVVIVSNDLVQEQLKGRFSFSDIYNYWPDGQNIQVDILRMKAITLMKQAGALPDSISQMLKSPIEYQAKEFVEGGKIQSLVVYRLRFSILGDQVEVKGRFLQEPEVSKKCTISIPESFQMTYTTTQTGFPLPELHTGIGLSYWLMTSPLRTELLGKLTDLYEQRHHFSHALLHHDTVKQKAWNLFKQKKHECETNKKEYLEAQKQFCLELVSAASKDSFEAKKIIETFFAQVDGFEQLAKCFHHMIELFLDKPYHSLQEVWLEDKEAGLKDADPQVRSDTIAALFSAKIEEALQMQPSNISNEKENISWQFIKCMGLYFAKAACSILLMEQSEKFQFRPPMLSDFELKVLAWIFKQMDEFADSMNEKKRTSLIEQIQSDRAIFIDANEKYIELATETETYYLSRFQESYQ